MRERESLFGGETTPHLPTNAVTAGIEYLQLSAQNLALVENGSSQLRWRQFLTNRPGLGRYETNAESGILRVDYRFGGSQEFFDTPTPDALEVIKIVDGIPSQHAIFGVYCNEQGGTFPMLIAGNLDFSDFDVITNLMNLVRGENTDRDVATILEGILSDSNNGTLHGTGSL
jgi:hypothetical protein